ncbi:transglycosylase SLT domain-containing protein [Pseudahrensia aquimaris]|uniref:Transglycosylase SLT domain-containing protein n=1 Tax=Pseudahrensia aquimaris TaxID=744461 RepID=A0ABW3FDI1_9HYPH
MFPRFLILQTPRIVAKAALTAALSSALVATSFATNSTGSVSTYGAAAQFGKLSTRGSVDIKPASATLKRGLAALDKRDMQNALAAREQLQAGSLERKVLDWAIAMNGNGVPARTLVGISSDLANWPGAKTMRINVERALVRESNSAALRVAFSQSQPESLEASIALAKAHLNAGDGSVARNAIAPIWHSRKLSQSDQRTILNTFDKVLSRDDHRARIEYLLTINRLREAERLAGKAGMTRLVKARAAVVRKQRGAADALATVPASQKSHPNYLVSHARHLRGKEQLSRAAKVLLSIDLDKVHPNAADALWVEKRILASDLIEIKKYKTAYSLASRNVAKSAKRRLDAEFLAGWIALRKIGDAKTAAQHFARLVKIASTPVSLSRGHYWHGRALEADGNIKDARRAYAKGAQHDTTFYGQLAAIKSGRSKINIASASPTKNDRASFANFELVQAIAKLESAGHPNRARTIYRHLARHLETPGHLALLAARAEARGDHQLGLQVGKTGFSRGMEVDKVAWPLGAIPSNARLGKSGTALAYAISRQESTFQIDARSHANALGLMQLLPGTAKQTARRVGVKYSKSRLTRDASYNALLGTAYLDQQMERFGGSLILTFIAYNAGPSRVNQWIERNGDPRGASLEFVVDWIEKIPFSETRNYVQRVMENLQVYKRRIEGSKLTIESDLRRGRGA